MRYAVAGTLLILAGCLSPAPYQPTLNYAVLPQPQVQQAPPTGKVLGVRPLDPAQSLRSKIALRRSDYVLEYYPSAEWAEPPRDVVTRTLTDALLATRHFADVGDARDVRPDYILTGELRNFEEIRTNEGNFGVVTARIEVRSAIDDKAVWADTLTAREPLNGEGIPALAAALSQATGKLAEQAAAAIVANTK